MQRKSLALLLLVGLLVLVSGTFSVLAQDDVAIVERLADASATEDFDSYVETYVETQNIVFDISLMGLTLSNELVSDTEGVLRIINTNGEPSNVDGSFITAYSESATGTPDASSYSYTLEGEFRLVDALLYVNAAFLEIDDPAGDVEAVPEGWAVYENTFELPGPYTELGLDEYIFGITDAAVEDMTEEDPLDLGSVVENVERLLEVAQDFTVTETNVNGMDVEEVNFTLNFGDVLALMEEEGSDFMAGAEENPLLPALLEGFGQLEVEVALLLTADDVIVGTAFGMGGDGLELEISNADLGLEEQLGPGSVALNMSVEFTLVSLFTEINSDLEPVAAPATE